jgi:ribonuclease Z
MPMLLMHMWLIGRQKPVRVHGLHHCLERTEDLMAAFSWDSWPQFFPVAFHRISFREEQVILDNADFRITSWPVQHFNVPTIGLRIESKVSGKIIGYSCDTAPVPNVVRLAYGADLLFHEASGTDPRGHSSASQAGETAREAHCKRLVLIHYSLEGKDAKPLLEEAARNFDGPIELAADYSVYDI